ncbi:MAG: VCBS repeat-containing protein, partial [Candidatus Omnitrophica bacterium]|nr:VCBS repeat-containing protein [Candidatus Omnitrophota bacterium]
MKASFIGTVGESRQALLWDGKNARGQKVPTGSYLYTVRLSNEYDGTYATTNTFGGPPISDTGIPTDERIPLAVDITAAAIIHNRRDSAFGAGWGLRGLEQLHPQPDGTILITDGEGSSTVFRKGPMPDLAVATESFFSTFRTEALSILLGMGTGSFQPEQRMKVRPDMFGSGQDAFSVAAGEFNQDGFQDLAVALESGDIAILLGKGGATFEPPQYVSVITGFSPALTFVAAEDLDQDGIQDLIVLSQADFEGVFILSGVGDGTFFLSDVIQTGPAPASVAIEDFDADGLPDLAVVHEASDEVVILLGTSGLQPGQRLPVGGLPRSITVEDFTSDGIVDLAVPNFLD